MSDDTSLNPIDEVNPSPFLELLNELIEVELLPYLVTHEVGMLSMVARRFRQLPKLVKMGNRSSRVIILGAAEHGHLSIIKEVTSWSYSGISSRPRFRDDAIKLACICSGDIQTMLAIEGFGWWWGEDLVSLRWEEDRFSIGRKIATMQPDAIKIKQMFEALWKFERKGFGEKPKQNIIAALEGLYSSGRTDIIKLLGPRNHCPPNRNSTRASEQKPYFPLENFVLKMMRFHFLEVNVKR